MQSRVILSQSSSPRNVIRQTQICTPCNSTLHSLRPSKALHAIKSSKLSSPAALRPGRRLVTVAAAKNDAKLPDSREEAISQACTAIATSLPSPSASKSSLPGFAAATTLLSVEIPVADESERAAMELANDVIGGLPSAWASQFAILSCYGNSPFSNSAATNSSCVLIVGPKTSQLNQLEQWLSSYSGSVAIVLNPEWAAQGGEEDAPPFLREFESVYCFMPILIKAFVVNTQEGAVFRCVSTAAAKSTNKKNKKTSSGGGFGSNTNEAGNNIENPWRIFMRQGNSWEAVARMQKRPSMTDVEVSFYNASAANSPLTQGAKMLKGMFNKK